MLKVNSDSKHQHIKFNQDEIMDEIKGKIVENYGDFGIACLNRGYNVKRFEPNEQILLLMVRRGCEEMVMSIVPLITTVAQKRCQMLLLHLSGTIRSSLKHLKLHCLRELRSSIGQKIMTEQARTNLMET